MRLSTLPTLLLFSSLSTALIDGGASPPTPRDDSDDDRFFSLDSSPLSAGRPPPDFQPPPSFQPPAVPQPPPPPPRRLQQPPSRQPPPLPLPARLPQQRPPFPQPAPNNPHPLFRPPPFLQGPPPPPPSPPPPRHGLFVDASCSAERQSAARLAIYGLGRLALAGRGAVLDHIAGLPNNPAPYFFPPSDYSYVRYIMETAVQSAQSLPTRPPTRVTCQDLERRCAAPGLAVGAYVASNPSFDIVLCARFFRFPPLEPPCTGVLSRDGLRGMGATSQPQVLLHAFVMALSGNVIHSPAYGTRACHALLAASWTRRDPAYGPRMNADSFARLAAWSHDVGLINVGVPPRGKGPFPERTCLAWFAPGGTPAAGEFPTEPQWYREYRETVA